MADKKLDATEILVRQVKAMVSVLADMLAATPEEVPNMEAYLCRELAANCKVWAETWKAIAQHRDEAAP
jgi:hypothetical protein